MTNYGRQRSKRPGLFVVTEKNSEWQLIVTLWPEDFNGSIGFIEALLFNLDIYAYQWFELYLLHMPW